MIERMLVKNVEMWVWKRMLKVSWVDKLSMQKYCRKYKKIRTSWTLYNIANSDGLDTS